ncbi:hypothetical protein LSCM4_00143 [Leishmania orientalis]|uniref:RanBP2-type domain-containing protein n=1 Tax=Leishmania orientalis TaxID=2249476 RepID=A0A836GCN2_9TRYP|nr:hypothetical protein LSCM4_00143 [Leishmania orientalis]
MRTASSLYDRAARLRATCKTVQVSLLLPRGMRTHTNSVRCRWSRGFTSRPSNESAHHSSAQEDMLVRILIQDAFNPASKSSFSRDCGDGASSDEHTHNSADSTGRRSGCLSQCEVAATKGGSVGGTVVTDSQRVSRGALQGAAVAPRPAVSASVQEDHWRGENTASLSGADEGVASATDSRGQNAAAEPFTSIRRAEQHNDVPRSLEWLCCACGTYSSLASSPAACRKCKASAAASYRSALPPMRQVPVMPAMWVCQRCSHTNHHVSGPAPPTEDRAISARAQRQKFICGQCSAPFGGVQNWVCPACDHFCPRAATQCPSCFADRPLSWTCDCCESDLPNSVFAVKCRGCGHERRRKYSNSVVRCPGCRDWNDVRWEICATCMAPLDSFALSREDKDSSKQAALTAPPLSESRRAGTIGAELVPNSAGVLHSKTVVNAAALLEAARALETAAGAGGLRRGNEETASVVPSSPPPPAPGDEERPRVAMRLPDNAWWCFNCNVVHRRNVTFCDICLQPRDVMDLRNKTELAAMQASSSLPKAEVTVLNSADVASLKGASGVTIVPATVEGDWQCPYCRKLRCVTQHDCCGHRREVPHGYWLCDRCCSTNRLDRECCLGCGERQERVCPWTCPECAWCNDAGNTVCLQCGVPNAPGAAAGSGPTASGGGDVSTSIACTVCSAPNHFEKSACYRCRARLRDVEWRCDACGHGHGHRTRSALRCEQCGGIRQFDLREEVWLCEVCSTPVFSGGEIPVRTHCPKCNAQRAPTATHYPSRWKCKCGLFNRSRVTECLECGARRRFESLDTIATCPRCFRDTPMDFHETCTHCRASLAECFMRWESNITLCGDTVEVAEALDESEMEAVPDDRDDDAVRA